MARLHAIIRKAAYASKDKIKKLYGILKTEGMMNKHAKLDYKKMNKKAHYVLTKISTIFKHKESTVRKDLTKTNRVKSNSKSVSTDSYTTGGQSYSSGGDSYY